MNQKAVEWLYEQLPELVEKGIIPSGSVELIHNHYGQVDKKLGGRTMLTMFGLIGAVLIGLGIILILAHNWEQMNRMTRTLIAVGILLVAQILAGFTIWFKKDHIAWTESTAVFLMVAIGASIALIGQTYHIYDNFNMALLVWMLLSLPLVYLMGVTAPALFYVIGVTIWAVNGDAFSMGKYFIWILLSLLGPYYWKLTNLNKYGNRLVLLSWVLMLCFYISFGIAFAAYLKHLAILIYGALFAITYFVGILWFDAPVSVWQRPLTLIGATGCMLSTFFLTFKDMWRLLSRWLSFIGKEEYLFAALILSVLLFLGIRVIHTKKKDDWLFGGVPLIIGFGFLLLFLDSSGINATVFCNVYLFLWGVAIICRGVRQESLGELNMGMLMVGTLIIMRFFDLNFSFVARGFVFVLLGFSFLVTNWIMMRRKKEVQHEQK